MLNATEKQEKCGETSVDVRPVYRPHTITTVILCDVWCWKFLWGQKVDYFHGCGNNRIGRKLLWVSYRPRWVMAFLLCSRRLFIRPFCHQLSKKCFHIIQKYGNNFTFLLWPRTHKQHCKAKTTLKSEEACNISPFLITFSADTSSTWCVRECVCVSYDSSSPYTLIRLMPISGR